MNYAEIKEYDIANGPGVRMTLFVSGCVITAKIVLMRLRGILIMAIYLMKQWRMRL